MSASAALAKRLPLRPQRALWAALIAFLLILLGSGAVKGWRDLEASRARERALAERVAATEERIVRLRERIVRLKDDPVTLERLARQELGLVRARDVVIVLPPTPASAAPRPAAPR